MEPESIDQVFWDAARFASPGERAAYLDRACAGDPERRRQVEELLEARAAAGSFLETPVVARGDAPGDNTRTGPANPDAELPLDFLAPSDQPGSLGSLGHYEVQEVIGRGGMGVVLKAFDDILHRVVAVKVMAAHLAASATARRRFTREARAVAAVAHEHVVTIHAVEEACGLPYIVMHYVAGQSLQDRLDRSGPLPVTEVLRIGMQAATGLAAAHAQGLVHRDVKPANILLENGVERVRLTDFGLARAVDDASLTQSGQVAGTPQYMSPEQAEGKPVDARSDLFSLGSVLYAMCTGRPPFRAASSMAVLKRVCEETPTPVREVNPEVPDWLDAAIARLHAKDPAGRFQSAAEVAELFGQCLAHLQHPSVVPAPAVAEHAPAPAPAPRRRRWAVAVAALVLGACLLAAAFVSPYLRQPWRGEVPRDPRAPVTFSVEASRPWQDTGVDVGAGDIIVVHPEGTWRKGARVCSAAGLAGAPRDRAILPEAPLLCLLVRIGDEAEPAPVRQREVFKARRGGRLFVQANDLDLSGNSDGLELTIAGGLHTGEAVEAPALLPVQAADRDWKPLLARIEASNARPDDVRDQVFAYCLQYAGTPHAVRAGQGLLKSPPLVNSIGMKLLPIPPGTFRMGFATSEQALRPLRPVDRVTPAYPQHEVVISRPFYMGVYHVTVGQFRAFVEATGYQQPPAIRTDPRSVWTNPGHEQSDAHPVVCISRTDALAFCDWLSNKEGKVYSLPTEAQWEYACRAGTQSTYYFGDDVKDLGRFAWYAANAEQRTHPVGQKEPNPWGLYDMTGNAYQWCLDGVRCYASSRVTDPVGPPGDGDYGGVLRGGCWVFPSHDCRSAQRAPCLPVHRSNAMGFRVVLLR